MLNELQPLIIQAAREELLPRFRQISHKFKTDGSLITEADLAMQQRVQNELSSHWPEYSFLAEEMTSRQQQRLLENNSSGLWCLDPLDGTSNFAMGIPFFAVSLALIQEGEIKLGLVYDPIRDECFTASKGEGVWLNNEALAKPETFPTEPIIGIIDYKRLTPELAVRLVRNPPFKSQRSFGSVAIDWCWMATGRGHVYLHGRQNLWDYAAGTLIFDEIGGYSATLDGEPVFNNSLAPRSAVAALDKNLFQNWVTWLSCK